MSFFLHYLLVGGLFAVIDALWLTIVAKKFYRKHLGEIMLEKPKMAPAVLFYLIAIFGIVVFVVNPALGANSISYAIGHGALLGLVMYATYELTNASTFKGWSKRVTIVDLLWGTFVTTVVSVLGFLILK